MISIIVPVHNTEAYLDQCVKSLVNQTYTDLEILLIDDSSTDGSGAIIDKWAEADSRVRAVHNRENLGVSRSRNIGLELARGEYIAFVDSDDFLDPLMYERLLALLEENKADVVVSSWNQFVGEKTETIKYLPVDMIVCSGKEALAYCMPRIGTGSVFYNMTIWDKLYRREALFDQAGNAILFNPSFSYCEDTLWQTMILRQAAKVVLSDEAYYYYRRSRPGNARSGLQQTTKHTVSAVTAYLEIFRILRIDENACSACALQMSLQRRILGMRVSRQCKDREVYRFCVKGFWRDLFLWGHLEKSLYGIKWMLKKIIQYVFIRFGLMRLLPY